MGLRGKRSVTAARFPDWEERLGRFIADRLGTSFAWGERDCCLFAADWVRTCTGEDPAQGLRGAYSDEAGALGVIRRSGGFCRFVSLHLCQPMMREPLRASRGDLAAVAGESEDMPALGVVLGSRLAVLTPRAGLVQLPVTGIIAAWRIG